MSDIKYLIKKDFEAYCRHYKRNASIKSFIYFFIHYPEFRVSIKTRMKLSQWGGGKNPSFNC